ncbi:uncharacterized protein PHALS_15286 [Plasmopara halstedii]|uniref:Uncharacterized protein n=1 Tax=Plasmopara halstedii TaxID=4781 RepID=A0A0P1ACC7_PLAHL|nr:uncharacterized protein PHALS_15286 [Plasmopara halstedii]CEG38073.1 hypothetical protein PHALS_15286 [Plasmopara halstedii]|eukprot:XP_024574442.1 hypothetical protein PHALS_15286 [Plasmopara halstedii]
MLILGRDLGTISSTETFLMFINVDLQATIHVSAVAKPAVLSTISQMHKRTLDTMSMLKPADSSHLHE